MERVKVNRLNKTGEYKDVHPINTIVDIINTGNMYTTYNVAMDYFGIKKCEKSDQVDSKNWIVKNYLLHNTDPNSLIYHIVKDDKNILIESRGIVISSDNIGTVSHKILPLSSSLKKILLKK